VGRLASVLSYCTVSIVGRCGGAYPPSDSATGQSAVGAGPVGSAAHSPRSPHGAAQNVSSPKVPVLAAPRRWLSCRNHGRQVCW